MSQKMIKIVSCSKYQGFTTRDPMLSIECPTDDPEGKPKNGKHYGNVQAALDDGWSFLVPPKFVRDAPLGYYTEWWLVKVEE